MRSVIFNQYRDRVMWLNLGLGSFDNSTCKSSGCSLCCANPSQVPHPDVDNGSLCVVELGLHVALRVLIAQTHRTWSGEGTAWHTKADRRLQFGHCQSVKWMYGSATDASVSGRMTTSSPDCADWQAVNTDDWPLVCLVHHHHHQQRRRQQQLRATAPLTTTARNY